VKIKPKKKVFCKIKLLDTKRNYNTELNLISNSWSKSKNWLAWIQDNVFKWSDMGACGLLFQYHYKNATYHVGLVQSGHYHHHLIKM
jgi:hypothetical protein